MNIRKRVLRHGPRNGVLAASIGAIVAAGGLNAAAWGQDAEDEAAADNTESIVVTGTRIRRDDFSAANATTVVTAQDMQNLGVISVADMVNQLPNNIASVSPEATADSPFFLGASIANLRGLNTAYGVRTLTLVDSRRMTPTNNGGGVDMNFIPSALVSRIETVTGGASATYGADAMAGVVNVILDDDVDNMTIDLSYETTDAGDGDTYNLSFGTGYKFFDNDRGSLTIGLDSTRTDAIEDCTTREYCQRGLGLLRNGRAAGGTNPYTLNPGNSVAGTQNPPPDNNPNIGFGVGRGTDIFYPGQPEWMITEGHRFSVTPYGVLSGGGYTQMGDLDDQLDPLWDEGWYEFNAAGNDIHPLYDNLTEDELAAIASVGTQVGAFASGSAWATPYGAGKGIYEDVPLRPETARDNLFTRFQYEFEGGIALETTLTLGQTRSESLQNQSRGNMQSFCVYPWNAYVAQGSDLMQTVVLGRSIAGVSSNARGDYGVASNPNNPPVDTPWGPITRGATGSCLQGPFLGGSYQPRPDGTEAALFDFAPGFIGYKDFSEQVDRRNINDSQSVALSASLTGDLFEGGSWTWDVWAQVGQTENRQTLSGWRAARRWDMALDAVMDEDGTIKCGIDVQNVPFTDFRAGNNPEVEYPDGTPIDEYGEWIRNKWQDYLFAANGDSLSDAERADVFNGLANGCVPFNPFGSGALTPEQIAYVFPTLFEGTDNDQTSLSVSFSGDAWKGIGDAGPMRMAAGYDWRENDTQNIADPNRFLGADFNFVGNSSSGQFDRIYGDNWWGRTTTTEAWVEFDLPLLQGARLADSLSVNTSFRRTENKNVRVSGVEGLTTPSTANTTDSWKATMQWQPVDVMRVRLTRSADTRAPAARELYATNSYATESGGQTEILNPWRYNFEDDAYDWDNGDQIIRIQGGNASLTPERSITETLGFVFQPSDALPGLSVSVDYYETIIEGGIEQIGVNQVIALCENEIGQWQQGPLPAVPKESWVFCNNIEFGDPREEELTGFSQEFLVPGMTTDSVCGGPISFFAACTPVYDENDQIADDGRPNPFYPYSNIITVAESNINVADYWSRGIDISASYFTQLGGGGSINARALVTRYLEQSIYDDALGRINVSGQTGGNNITDSFGSFGVNYSPTPTISGNLFMTYAKNAFSFTAQVRYIGGGKLNKQGGWIGPGDVAYYSPQFNGAPIDASALTCARVTEDASPNCSAPIPVSYNPNRDRTVSTNDMPSWALLNLSFNYDFGRSRIALDRFESMSVFMNIDNVGDRIPTFFSGTGAGGLNTSLYSGMGRSYRMGVRMQF